MQYIYNMQLMTLGKNSASGTTMTMTMLHRLLSNYSTKGSRIYSFNKVKVQKKTCNCGVKVIGKQHVVDIGGVLTMLWQSCLQRPRSLKKLVPALAMAILQWITQC